MLDAIIRFAGGAGSMRSSRSGKPVTSIDALLRALSRHPAGTDLEVHTKRGGDPRVVTVKTREAA